MDEITVTIKAVDLAEIIKQAKASKLDIDWRDNKIKRLESEIEKLNKQLEEKEN